ncbi:hypothetical protein AC628_04565 [Bradyrhizobium sp. NAS96.2]|nr:hypothetical protein AC628_04565 [Bradyrhizobium sp. NAS96.2]
MRSAERASRRVDGQWRGRASFETRLRRTFRMTGILRRPIHVIASEAKQSITPRAEKWIASSLSLLAMTAVTTPHVAPCAST